MINTTTKININEKLNKSIDKFINESGFLPNKWEKIKEIQIQKRNIFFKFLTIDTVLWRKFSFKNSLEKYSLKNKNGKILGNLDIKIYKDNVYIINLDIKSIADFNEVFIKLVQIAVEKSIYNTTDKEVKFNLSMPLLLKNKTKKLLLINDFIIEENQSKYEKEIFGEIFILKANSSFLWLKKIKQMPILINK